MKLGTGYALALSPDEKWVLSLPDDYRSGLSLLPIGPGMPKTVFVVGLTAFNARWLRDGLRIALVGLSLGDKRFRLYVASVEGGVPAPISDADMSPYYIEISRDDRLGATKDVDDVVTLYPLDGGAPIPLRELGKDVVPIGWNADGQLWVKEIRGVPSRILRYDVRNRRVVEERTVSPSDLTGVALIHWVRITPNGRSMAFDYERILGHLSLLDGLAPTRR